MTTAAAAPATPPAPFRLDYAREEGQVSFVIHEDLFPKDAIYGAAYLFVDRCWVFLSRPSEAEVGVHLKPKSGAKAAEELDSVAGEFANELLNQSLRERVGANASTLREYTMARAFFTTPVQSSIDALLAELDAEELEEDELEIAVPWEESDD